MEFYSANTQKNAYYLKCAPWKNPGVAVRTNSIFGSAVSGEIEGAALGRNREKLEKGGVGAVL